MMETKLLEIGDKILVNNVFFKYLYVINRVTKTKAIGVTDIGLKEEFKREYVKSEYIRPYRHRKWDTTDRKLIK